MTLANELEILLVEDNVHDAELTIRALKRRHLANNLVHLKDGAEALDFIFGQGAYVHRDIAQHPKVVLLDLKLPKVDGLEVLREIKNNPRTKAIPVVILTASREERDLVNGYQLGVNAYIQKPVDFEQFRQIVKQLGMFWLVVNQPPPTAAFKSP